MAYLVYMAIRIMEIKRILKPAGSIYLHYDPTASHYLKLLMDEVFGKRMFRNEIVWSYTGNSTPKVNFQSKHDVILFYAKTKFNNFLSPMWKENFFPLKLWMRGSILLPSKTGYREKRF